MHRALITLSLLAVMAAPNIAAETTATLPATEHVSRQRSAFVHPQLNPPQQALRPFEFVEVGPKIPNYTVGKQAKPRTTMQQPLSPEESMKHLRVPEGFHVELFADERDFAGKPIAMSWDQRGRLWLCETVDYPNQLQPQGKGRDRIRICEDTDGDWKADKFTVFAEKLSIPTAICFYRGGAIVQNGSETIYLKDTNGDDVADVRKVLINGWGIADTHGGVSNFRYGLDNWIWGMQGYNNSAPAYDFDDQGTPQQKSQPFRMGFFRFKLDNADPPNVKQLEFIRSTDNNTWGLGFSEDGHVFGSTANRNPSVSMPIANRYYERVKGWAPKRLEGIADTHKFEPITKNVRQVDHHGGYTAAAGHALYTARRYPQQWWNRTAFVCGPTGHLVGTFVLTPQGADFASTSPGNFLASDDEWTAPIAAEVGPDGNLWVLDWYNYIVQHNPTPHGFKTGPGNAYESDLRDKKHGRIYRVVYGKDNPPSQLDSDKPEELVATLNSDNMFWRLHAQRLLVERNHCDVTAALRKQIEDESVDKIGLNVGAIHALWTLQALYDSSGKQTAEPAQKQQAIDRLIRRALSHHPCAGVRENAADVLATRAAIDGASLSSRLDDPSPRVRLATLLAVADAPMADEDFSMALVEALTSAAVADDPILLDAATSAAATHADGILIDVANLTGAVNDEFLNRVAIVAEHWARSRPNDKSNTISFLLTNLTIQNEKVSQAILQGMAAGWPRDHQVQVEDIDEKLAFVLSKIKPTIKPKLLRLAKNLGSKKLKQHTQEIVATLARKLADESATVEDRIATAYEMLQIQPDDPDLPSQLLNAVTPQTEPALAVGLIQAAGTSTADGVGQAIAARFSHWTPKVKQGAVQVLLSRADLTEALLSGVKQGKLTLAELSLDQQQALANHPHAKIAAQAKTLLASGGSLPNADRQRVLHELLPLSQQTGDAAAGKAVFIKQCSKCHVHRGEGKQIGPDLTGMAVHPKKELLAHIVDPSRDVEGNFRVYNVVTDRGKVVTGMLATETKTTIEIIDADGKSQTVQREEIDELIASSKSLMPEGFEKQLTSTQWVDLLEFLTQRGRYVPLNLAKVATVVSTQGMFHSKAATAERLILPDWKPKQVGGVPFNLVDPQGQKMPNVVLLHGPNGVIPPTMPKSVTLPCNTAAKAIHLLSGISGWGFPASREESVSLVIRLHYVGGKSEDHELRNAVHFADYIRRVDVPGSKFAFAARNQQVRYLSIQPKQTAVIERIELLKGPDRSSPIVVAVTVETIAADDDQAVGVGPPPASLKLDPFYKKYIDADGYPIVASEKVDDFALKEAAFLVNQMLAQRPDVKRAMVLSGSRLLIMAHDEFQTDLPEYGMLLRKENANWVPKYARHNPKDYWDARARGMGGSATDPVCSCAEENLLGFPGDPYATENILIHELAHNIHLRGMVNLDDTFDKRLKQTYDDAMKADLWKGKYASVNHHEYFAEGVQSWFNNNREPDHDHNHVNTRKELIEYDPGLAKICREVFGDTQLKYTKPATRLIGHLQGYDPSTAPTFTWPERLIKQKDAIIENARARSDGAQE